MDGIDEGTSEASSWKEKELILRQFLDMIEGVSDEKKMIFCKDNKMKRRKIRSLPVAAEICEERTLLSASNVLVEVSGGYLRIDARGNNDHFLLQTNSNGVLQVIGQNVTINGGTGPFNAKGITCSERIILRGTGDVVTIGQENHPRTILPAKCYVDLDCLGHNTLNVANTSIKQGAMGGAHGLTIGQDSTDTIYIAPDVTVVGPITYKAPDC